MGELVVLRCQILFATIDFYVMILSISFKWNSV